MDIDKLAKDTYPEYCQDIGGIDMSALFQECFIEGYTTCQQTEVEPLQKEIETVKNLLVRVHTAHSYGKFTDDLYNEITEIVDNENYIDSRDKEIERLKGIINNSIRINLLTASLQARYSENEFNECFKTFKQQNNL